MDDGEHCRMGMVSVLLVTRRRHSCVGELFLVVFSLLLQAVTILVIFRL